MRITRKFLTALIALCLIFSIATPALTVGAETVASGTCGDNLTWVLDDQGTLTISGKGEMDDYNYSSTPSWYKSRDKILSVVIGDGVTSIGEDAFSDCRSLTSVTIGNSVTSIGDGAFSDCYGLTNVTIEDSVTSIGDCAFQFCQRLTSIVIPDSVTSIGQSAFNICDSLTNVTIGDSVTSICGSAFSGCRSLISVTIPDSVISIGESAFDYCDSLEEIRVNENNLYYSSDECGVLLNKDKTKIIKAPGGLKGEYTIPDSVNVIGNDAFNMCSFLTSVTIPYSVTSIGEEAFYDCNSLEEIRVDEDNPNYSSDEYGMLFNKDKTEIVRVPGGFMGEYTIPDTVTSVGDGAFSHCENLTNVIIPNSVASIGENAFDSCMRLISVSIGDGVTSIGDYAFSHCESLNNVTIPDSVTSIGYCAFFYCKRLYKIKFEGNKLEFREDCFRLAGIRYLWSRIVDCSVPFGVILILIIGLIVFLKFIKKYGE